MTERRKKKFQLVLKHRQPTLTVVMENIHDPHNVSAILRSADAVGVPEVQLVYVGENFPKLGKKSSAGTNKWVTRRSFKSIQECYGFLHAGGFRIYASRLGAAVPSLYDLDLTGPTALVFGNEHRGVSEEAALHADEHFQIPMVGMSQSLNVSVACAVALYEAFRQRQTAGLYKKPMLKRAEIRKLFDDWSRR